MTVWSGQNGHTKVGIALSLSDSNPAVGEVVTVTATYYLQTVNWTYNDRPNLNWRLDTVNSGIASMQFTNNLGSNQTMTITTQTHNVTVTGSPITVYAHADISGEYDGSAPSLDTTITVPAGQGTATAPGAPYLPIIGNPGAVGTQIGARSINWGTANNGGSALTAYQIMWGTSSSFATWDSAPAVSASTLTYTIAQGVLLPNSAYYVRVRAKNGVGWGTWSGTQSFTTPVASPVSPTGSTGGGSDGAGGTRDASTYSGGAVAAKLALNWTRNDTANSSGGGSGGRTDLKYDIVVTNANASPTSTTPGSGNCVVSALNQSPTSNYSFTSGLANNVRYYGWVRVTSATSPAYTGGWVALGQDTTMPGFPNGNVGSLLKRLQDAFQVIGSDVAASHLPSGVMMMWAGGNAAPGPPSGWLVCDGSAVSRTTYASLFATLSTTYGNGDGSTTFNLPNFQSRGPMGYNASDSQFNVRGRLGGENTHLLTIAEMPAHDHAGIPTVDSAPLKWGVTAATGSGASAFTSQGAGTNLFRTASQGGGGAHNNVHQNVTTTFIIKI